MKVSGLNKYKDSCYSALSRDLTEFEKNFLLIAGGILAFSITFIKDIIKITEAQYLLFLFTGWGLIIFSIAIMMHTFLRSANASDSLWKTVDSFILENNFHNDEDDLTTEQWLMIKNDVNIIFYKSKTSLRKQRRNAVNLFIVGLFSFSLFVSLNLWEEKASQNQKSNSIKDSTGSRTPTKLKVDSSIKRQSI